MAQRSGWPLVMDSGSKMDGAEPVGSRSTAVPQRPPRPAGPPAPETARLYAADWAAFTAWCRAAGHVPLPAAPATVAAYLADIAPALSPGTLARRRAAIAYQHRRHGLPPPTRDRMVREALQAARQRASGPRRPPPNVAQLQRMAQACPGDLAGTRDRALLLLAAHTGLGRAALVGLDAEPLRFLEAGLHLARPGPEGLREVRSLMVARAAATPLLCPVRAMEAWLRTADILDGPVFRKVDRWGNVEHRRLGTDAIRRIWQRRLRAIRRIRRGKALP